MVVSGSVFLRNGSKDPDPYQKFNFVVVYSLPVVVIVYSWHGIVNSLTVVVVYSLPVVVIVYSWHDIVYN